MAKAENPQDRKALEIIDRHAAIRDGIIARLIAAIKRIFAELFAKEQATVEEVKRDLGVDEITAEVIQDERIQAPRREAVRRAAQLAQRAEQSMTNVTQAEMDKLARVSGVTPKTVKPPPTRPAARQPPVTPPPVTVVKEPKTPKAPKAPSTTGAPKATSAPTTSSVKPPKAVHTEPVRFTFQPSPYPAQRARKVAPEDEWSRVLDDWEEAVRQGRAAEEAARAAAKRIEDQADNDVNAAMRDGAANHVKHNPKAVAYRRVVHPEKSDSGVCGLCLAAASQAYTVENLMPLHERCKCSVAPIYSWDERRNPGIDIGGRLNRMDKKALDKFLSQVYDHSEDKAGPSLSQARFKIDWHDELGPRLKHVPRAHVAQVGGKDTAPATTRTRVRKKADRNAIKTRQRANRRTNRR